MAPSSITAASMACDDDSKTLRFIEEMSRNARAMQQNLLAQILAENAETEYLKAFGLEGATDRETFKSKIPMVTYEDIQPLIRRIADGDRSPILSVHPVSEFIISTGTSTGEGKLIPTIKKESDQRLLLCSLMPPIINQHLVKGVSMNGKMLLFMFTKPESKTKGGIVVRSSLTSFYKSDHFKNRYNDVSDVFITPNEAIYCDDSFQSMYTQLLYGLYEREHVLVVGTMFASGLLQAIRFLQLNWQQLTHDIRTGTLNSKVNDVPIRECITRILRPEPDLAESISRDCAKGDWEGIIARIWPKAKFLQTVITGTMAQYVSTLDYYSGGLPIVSMVYASSECYFGINLNPMCKPSEVSYTIMPFLAYFEFLPHDPNSPEHASPELVDLVDVEIGKEYELVITTFAGFYRYRMGDILRVIGFHNSLPQFQFVRRKNVILSIDSDKTKEPELQEAVENASQLLHESNTSVVEYTSYAETKAIPGHYVIYWELMQMGSKGSPSDKVLDQCCLAMEESFDQQYRRCRVVDKSIGPLEIRVVENGTFEELMNYAISKGASMSQYKVPKCVSAKPMVDLLESRVMSKHFSPSLPHWTSEQSL